MRVLPYLKADARAELLFFPILLPKRFVYGSLKFI